MLHERQVVKFAPNFTPRLLSFFFLFFFKNALKQRVAKLETKLKSKHSELKEAKLAKRQLKQEGEDIKHAFLEEVSQYINLT